MQKTVLIATMMAVASIANAQEIHPIIEGSPPVPPLSEQAIIGNYCVYGNLIYSLAAGLCVGKTGYVCVPSGTDGFNAGDRGYWHERKIDKFVSPACQ
jgi:hypothetical protein